MTTEDPTPIRVDIVSDVVCPWCAIGYYQLLNAAEATGIPFAVQWHPFELNPQMGEEGENLREHVAAKYGTSPAESEATRDRMTALGEALGFTFNYADDMRMWNTFRAHQLIRWAGAQGAQHATKLALFEAFFTRRENVSDPEVLGDVAASVGLDRAAALTMLDSGTEVEPVREEERFWTSKGVTGVPAMVFERQHLVTGAQGEETYGRILELLKQERAA